MIKLRKWFIAKQEVDNNKRISTCSFLGKFQISENSLTLYNKNKNKNFTFLYPTKCCNRLGYYIWRNVVPNYFKNIIKPLYNLEKKGVTNDPR